MATRRRAPLDRCRPPFVCPPRWSKFRQRSTGNSKRRNSDHRLQFWRILLTCLTASPVDIGISSRFQINLTRDPLNLYTIAHVSLQYTQAARPPIDINCAPVAENTTRAYLSCGLAPRASKSACGGILWMSLNSALPTSRGFALSARTITASPNCPLGHPRTNWAGGAITSETLSEVAPRKLQRPSSEVMLSLNFPRSLTIG